MYFSVVFTVLERVEPYEADISQGDIDKIEKKKTIADAKRQRRSVANFERPDKLSARH